MTSPSLATGQLPGTTTFPTIAGTPGAAPAGARSAATSTARTGHDTSFARLMNLQGRGRELEATLTAQAAAATPADPAATAEAQQAGFHATELRQLRELVGPTPGGNARKALAAIVERLERGGDLQPTDRGRVRLAIAADEHRVDRAGAAAFRHAIVALDTAYATANAAMQDPTLVQDPARLASLTGRNAALHEAVGALQRALGAGRLDPEAARAVAARVTTSTGAA